MRRLLPRLGALVLLVTLVTGCDQDGGGGGGDERDRSSFGTAETRHPARQAALAQARERWEGARIDDYDWSYERVCFCPGLAFDLEVRDGELSGFVALAGSAGALPPGDDTGGAGPDYRTVEDLFDLIESSLDADSLTVEYDSQTGRPTRISIDPDRDAVDEELGVTVSAFTAAD